jgi:ABC-type transport system involved in multi-copper enzyme maturation permease subunit
MRATTSLIRREFAAYFTSPVGYVAVFAFLVLTGLLFNLALNLLTEQGPRGVEFPMQVFLGGAESPVPALVAGVLFWGLFPAVTGILTSRLLAEERGTGTLEVLLTAPIRDWQVVLAKFLACFGFYLLLWLLTLVYLPVLLDLHATWKDSFTPFSIAALSGIALLLLAAFTLFLGTNGWLTLALGLIGAIATGVGGYLHYTRDAEKLLWITAGIDPAPVYTSYLGIVLAGAMFLALGLLVSSLVKSQLVAWMLALLLGLVFVLPALLRWWFENGSLGYSLVYFISVPEHFRRTFTRGQLDTRPLVLYVTVMLFCLFMTVRSLEARRLR